MFDKIKLTMKAGMAFRGAGAGLFAPDRADEAIALYDEIRGVDLDDLCNRLLLG